jgi:hypothetical protein
MKNQLYILSFIFFTTLFSGSLFAQSADRFDRDIRIAEGIIEEIFEADATSTAFGSRHIRDVTGRYIPGYGIHFRVGANFTPSIIEVVLQDQAEIRINGTLEQEELQNLGREFIEQRFMEYLKNYAPLFKNLPDEEVIRLTIGQHNNGTSFFMLRTGVDNSRQTIANITAWAKASDIRAYDSRSIDDKEFESRVEMIDLGERETERDQTVFASILQTSLEEVSDSLRVRRSPPVEYLPGLGVSFNVNASLRTGMRFDFGDIQINELKIETDSLSVDFSNILDEINFDEVSRIAERIDSLFSPEARGLRLDSTRKSLREIREAVDKLHDPLTEEEVRELVNRFHIALKQTVQDYGPTLRSLADDEMLMITINWGGRHSALPARTELRIQKSDFLTGVEPVLEEVARR